MLANFFLPLVQQRNASQGRLIFIFLDHTTVGGMRLDKGSARLRDFYLTTHNTHNRQTSMLSAGFEPAIPARELLETLALDRGATGTGFAEYWAGVKPNSVLHGPDTEVHIDPKEPKIVQKWNAIHRISYCTPYILSEEIFFI